MRGQLFTTDFLVSVLVITAVLGLWVHALEFSVRGFPSVGSSSFLLSFALLSSRQSLVLNSTFVGQGAGCNGRASGFAWCYPLSSSLAASRFYDSDADLFGSLSVVYENGRPFGLGHATPLEIQQLGGGRFSDWFDAATGQHYLLFSSSDGSSPAQNGRTYVLEFVTVPSGLLRDGSFCVHESLSSFPTRILQDNCRFRNCSAVAASERAVACGSSVCAFSVRVCNRGV